MLWQGRLFVVGVLAVLSCSMHNGRSAAASCSNSIPKQYPMDVAEVAARWKKDSLGCMKLRTHQDLPTLIGGLREASLNVQDVVDLLGEPNQQVVLEQYIMVLGTDSQYVARNYYYDTGCKGGVVRDDYDQCWLSFLTRMNSDSIVRIEAVCQ